MADLCGFQKTNILLRHRDEMLSAFSDDSLANFEALFARINTTLSD